MLDLIDWPTGPVSVLIPVISMMPDTISSTITGVKQEFDSVVGLDKIKVIHLNDSNVKGAKKTDTKISVSE